MTKSRKRREHWLNREVGGMPNWASVAVLCVLGVLGLFVWSGVAKSDSRPTWTPPPNSAPSATTGEEAIRAVVVGDSWSTGLRASSPAAAWPVLVEEATAWELEVLAVSGSGYTVEGPSEPGMFGDRVESAAQFAPDVIVFQGSINDLDANGIESAAQDALSTARDLMPDARCVAVGPSYFPREDGPERVDALHLTLSTVASDVGCEYIDARDWVPADQFADPGHPNDEGYATFAAHMIVVLGAT